MDMETLELLIQDHVQYLNQTKDKMRQGLDMVERFNWQHAIRHTTRDTSMRARIKRLSSPIK